MPESLSGSPSDLPSNSNIVKLLVVEDDDFMRESMRLMIESICDKSESLSGLQIPALDLQVEYSASGEHAWDLMRVHRFDIALIDLNLPGVSGLDLSWCVQQSDPEASHGPSAAGSGKVGFCKLYR